MQGVLVLCKLILFIMILILNYCEFNLSFSFTFVVRYFMYINHAKNHNWLENRLLGI